MNARPKDIAQLPQEEVVIEGPQAEAPTELREKVEKKVNNLINMWKERRTDQQARLESGGRITPVGYKYWDCLLLGPYQSSTFNRPAKIIAANEWAMMVGLIWVNPDLDPDGGASGAELFAGRPFNACFRAINIGNVINVTSHLVTGVFASLAQEFTPVYWWFQAPDPGPYPTMHEVHFAVDLTQANLSFATFATWHWDPENDSSIPGWNTPWWMDLIFQSQGIPEKPVMAPHFDHDIPARFLVYHR